MDIALALTFMILYSWRCFAQETNSRASGRVISDHNEKVASVNITVTHEPTQNRYVAVTGDDGYFHLFNLKPGGPYSVILSCSGYETLKKTGLFIHLSGEHFIAGNIEIAEFFLQKKIISLNEVVINARNIDRNKSGLETNISGFTLNSMPNINRNFQDLVRLVPQAKVTGDGVMSLAGQNNRFNAFFIDGANNNDIHGVSVNGMNNGQTGSPPISIEAIDELNVLLAPYDVQYGNFTGGSINAITRSGSNENKSSVWYYFRNENLAGRSPIPLPKTGSNGEFYRPRLSSFFNQTFGIWNSGAFVNNKLFYFALLEKQSETRPQPFDMRIYQGNSKEQDLIALSEFIKDTYKYDPGSFLETKDVLQAIRIILKLDWNQSIKNKFTLSYRYNQAERTFPPRVSGNNSIVFENSGIRLPGITNSVSFEWKRFFKRNMNNRLLLTYTNQNSNRKWRGKPFPLVMIIDGSNRNTISFGSEANTGDNDLNANDVTLFNVFKYIKKQHVFTLGTDISYTTLDNKNIPFYFGAYTFSDLSSFINGALPIRLQRSYYLSNEKYNSARFHALRTSIFLNDEIRTRSNLKLNFGLRLDVNSVTSTPRENDFFNSNGIHLISDHYDLDGAISGRSMKPHWAISPRISIEDKLQKPGINIKAGAGVFVGHIVNIWHHDVFNNNIGSLDIKPLQFIADPYGQPDSNLQDLNLIARHFKYPSVFRSSLIAEKRLWKSWTFSMEGIFTKNIQEVSFKNVNILPPKLSSEPPDSRNIYSTTAAPSPILNSFGTNYLLTNNHGRKGYSYSISVIAQKQAKNFSFNSSYTYGRSWALFEITGAQTPIRSQWTNMETVNGRNYNSLSISDNDLRHRITTWISKKFNYRKEKAATTVALFYNGQSGTPYSYVYSTSMINDNGRPGQNFDLIYIPTGSDLITMNFADITNSAGQVEYTVQQQKDFLNTFIEADKYLQKHRGEFAKRNGARLPFTHVIDLRLQQDFIIKIKGKNVGVIINYDVFNFANMLNKNWGRTYFLTNDSYSLITFFRFTSTTPPIIPQYQARPFTGKPYSLQTSTIPGNSARWISQLGMKINLN